MMLHVTNIASRIARLGADRRFRIFFGLVAAFVIAGAVTVDQQSKNLIKLLVAAGLFVTVFNWNELRQRSQERDPVIFALLAAFYLSILISIAVNPINENTLHNVKVMSIGLTSIFIWHLLIVINFRAEYFWWAVILCAVSSGLYALVQTGLYGLDYRASGSSGREIMFGDVAMVSGVMSLAAINQFKGKTAYLEYLPFFACLSGVGASLLSGSRGAWIFLPFAIAIALYHQHVHHNVTFRFSRRYVIAIVVLCAAIFGLFSTHTQVSNRLELAYLEAQSYLTQHTDASASTSVGQRLEMWRAALIAFRKAPFFGIGPGAFEDHLVKLANNDVINEYLTRAIPEKTGGVPHSHAHNEYLNTLATRGLVGLSAVLALLFSTLVAFYRMAKSEVSPRSDYGLAGVLLVTGYLFFAVTESVLYHAVTANFFFLTLVSLLYLSRKSPTLPESVGR